MTDEDVEQGSAPEASANDTGEQAIDHGPDPSPDDDDSGWDHGTLGAFLIREGQGDRDDDMPDPDEDVN